jgi:hypothetical protein
LLKIESSRKEARKAADDANEELTQRKAAEEARAHTKQAM